MFDLYAGKNKLAVRQREPVTSGSVNVHRVRFAFSPDWDGLTRTAVFSGGGETRSVLLDETNECVLPWEVLQKPYVPLEAGVYGTRGGDTVLPTIWANLGNILEGVTTREDAQPPTPDLWRQELERKGDRLDYTDGGDLGLYAGDKLLSAVPIAGGGADGTTDHQLLSGRDAQNQHPISAISGLEETLAKIPVPMTAEQLRKILMNGGQEHA